MFRLAHLSDIHLGPLPELSYRELASKRITGYINWQRNRKQAMFGNTLLNLVADMRTQRPDHVAVTGDLVNLATRKEIEGARLWLENLGDPAWVSVVPGNHDAYVPGALKRALAAWRPWSVGDGGGTAGHPRFPYLRVRGPVAIVGTSSAEATAPFFATGTFKRGQALATARLLEQARERGLFRVLMIHHPPIAGAAAWSKRLIGKQYFSKVIHDVGAELVLHGHTHLDTLYWLTGPGGDKVPVVGVPSASQAAGGDKPASRYNLFEIEGEPGNWSLTQRERGLSPDSAGIGWVRERQLLSNGTAVDARPRSDAREAGPADAPLAVEP
ncbi:metallophosphoesterase family protein [Aureimonas jatrophae]|uniref:3',5'-cyclic AMP phosphodiesterase CpdA n=1 Tax=Aureimonas jatrophae TaxID=1166073 RepID=A0A1H0EMJ6_9HYPH|nr:metallophosphoesterase [Aureimonas jatrophae]MBB3950425.1 3',5'-cyclic AMP phosphodiesterase CpdA [Aureimonas jatrophae]SDN83546.1 3',5'-cyclic AMP phosphodiesterase CpdA [Aureimonas jatrophae]